MDENVQIARSAIAEMKYDSSNRILHIYPFDWAEMNYRNTVEHQEIIGKLTNQSEYFALVEAKNYFYLDSDALEISASKKLNGKRKASALYNLNPANRLNLELYKRSDPDHIPVRLFEKRNDALKWLQELRSIDAD